MQRYDVRRRRVSRWYALGSPSRNGETPLALIKCARAPFACHSRESRAHSAGLHRRCNVMLGYTATRTDRRGQHLLRPVSRRDSPTLQWRGRDHEGRKPSDISYFTEILLRLVDSPGRRPVRHDLLNVLPRHSDPEPSLVWQPQWRQPNLEQTEQALARHGTHSRCSHDREALAPGMNAAVNDCAATTATTLHTAIGGHAAWRHSSPPLQACCAGGGKRARRDRRPLAAVGHPA